MNEVDEVDEVVADALDRKTSRDKHVDVSIHVNTVTGNPDCRENFEYDLAPLWLNSFYDYEVVQDRQGYI